MISNNYFVSKKFFSCWVDLQRGCKYSSFLVTFWSAVGSMRAARVEVSYLALWLGVGIRKLQEAHHHLLLIDIFHELIPWDSFLSFISSSLLIKNKRKKKSMWWQGRRWLSLGVWYWKRANRQIALVTTAGQEACFFPTLHTFPVPHVTCMWNFIALLLLSGGQYDGMSFA